MFLVYRWHLAKKLRPWNNPERKTQSLWLGWALVRGSPSSQEAPCTCGRWKERPVAMETVGQPRLPAACEEKALGRIRVRCRNSPITTTQPTTGGHQAKQHLAVSITVQEGALPDTGCPMCMWYTCEVRVCAMCVSLCDDTASMPPWTKPLSFWAQQWY